MKKRNKYPIDKDFKKWEHLNPPLNKFALFLVQKFMKVFSSKAKSDKYCTVEKINVPFGEKKIQCFLYSPKNIDKNSPCLIYYHGGGFVLPASPHHYNNAKKYALGANCKVVFVNYPLAPKNKFPIPVKASFAVYKWVIENAETLSIDKEKIAVGGDSAGGNISSIVSMMASDEKITKPCGQMLIYPAIGLDYATKSMQTYVDTPMCNSRDYEKYLKYYLNSEKDKENRYISPIRAESFDIFPTTYIETAEFDCLRDEAIIFAYLLNRSGVKLFLNKTKGTIHGYDIEGKSNITKNSINKRIYFLNQIFNN